MSAAVAAAKTVDGRDCRSRGSGVRTRRCAPTRQAARESGVGGDLRRLGAKAALLGIGEEVRQLAGLLALLHVAPEAHGQQGAVGFEEGVAQGTGGDEEGVRRPGGESVTFDPYPPVAYDISSELAERMELGATP